MVSEPMPESTFKALHLNNGSASESSSPEDSSKTRRRSGSRKGPTRISAAMAPSVKLTRENYIVWKTQVPPAVEMKPRSASEETVTTVVEEREEERYAVGTMGRRKKKTRTPAKPSGGEHRCSQCSWVFLTGQALGGHMGKHRQPRRSITFYNFLNVPNRCLFLLPSAGSV
ncbi:uncharacterized protein LOC144704427 [Wolffia australiana]